MMTMRTNAEPMNIIAMGNKIGKVTSVISRQAQWSAHKVALVTSDILMTGLAFRLAYFFRFEAQFNFFDESGIVSVEHYRLLVTLSSFLWLLIFAINGL